MPRVAPTALPLPSTAMTISGSGLFQVEVERTPISSPQPTADSGGALVKTSASGPMATSRYCDHMPSAISVSFSFCASAEPGTTDLMSVPMRSASCWRISWARPGTPLARSSITRSMADTANVTPQALTHCRSVGASSFTFPLPSQALVRPRSSMSPRSRPSGTPFQSSSSADTVGAAFETSNTRPSFTTTGVGPSPRSMRPTRMASRQSVGRGNFLLSVMGTVFQKSQAEKAGKSRGTLVMARCQTRHVAAPPGRTYIALQHGFLPL